MKNPKPLPIFKGPENEKKKIAYGAPKQWVERFQILCFED
jgi:hypothetical protein